MDEFILYCILVLLVVLIGVVIYQIRMDFYNRSKMFEIQIEMAKAQQAVTKELTWDELKKVINDIVSFTVSTYITTNGLLKMSNEELSIVWTMIIGDLCTKIEMSISSEIKRQALKSISEEYFREFIKNSVEITVVYNLEQNRNNKVNNRLASIQKEVPRANQRLNQVDNKK